MCNQNTPSVNLQTAVLMQVQEFVNSGQSFSRYDITKALRQKCNDGLLEIPEVEDTDPNASYRYDVRKDAVDAIFEQLYQNCLVNGLPPLRYDYNPNLGYRVFSVDTNSAPATPSPVYASVPTTPTPATPVTPTSTVTLTDGELRRRIDQYMNGCQKLGKIPTRRQIQSAIKRNGKSTGLSRQECGHIAVSLGYQYQ